jgi:hypothetical protein
MKILWMTTLIAGAVAALLVTRRVVVKPVRVLICWLSQKGETCD